MKLYFKVIAILALPLIFVVAYALCPIQFPPPGWTLSKLHFATSFISPPLEPVATGSKEEVQFADKSFHTDVKEEATIDTCPQRILFLGDSMAEGLVRRMADYAQENEHNLSCIIWYNSTTRLWASSDTLQYYIQKYQPTFYMVCIGGNEQFVKNLTQREEYIHKIIGTFGNTPFIWIGVPSWKEDTGFNALVQKCVGENRYFDSKKLTLTRGSDRIHPTFGAASLWMDSIASWMQSSNVQYPIRMQKPASKATQRYPLHLLQPTKAQ